MTQAEIIELTNWLELQRPYLSESSARGVDKLMPELQELQQNPAGCEPVPGTLLWKLRELRQASVRRFFSRD